MARELWLIETVRHWRLTSSRGAPAERMVASEIDPASLARQCQELIQQQGWSRRVRIGLASDRVLAVGIPNFTPAMAKDRRLLHFAFEEQLPIAAEELAADFLLETDSALGVGVEIAPLFPIVAELERLGIEVQSIAPTVFLAVEQFLSTQPSRSQCRLVWQDGAFVEIVDIGAHLPIAWRRLPAECNRVRAWLRLQPLQAPPPVKTILINVDNDLAEAWDNESTERIDQPPLAEQAQLALAQRRTGWAELRQGALQAGDSLRSVRGPVREALAAGCLLLVATIVGFGWQAWQAQQQLAALHVRQEQEYRQWIPTGEIPPDVNLRLESERSRARASRQADREAPLPTAALPVLHRLVAGLDPALRLKVQEVRIEDGRGMVRVLLREGTAVASLVRGLEAQDLQVDPPSITQTDNAVAVRLDLSIPAVATERRE